MAMTVVALVDLTSRFFTRQTVGGRGRLLHFPDPIRTRWLLRLLCDAFVFLSFDNELLMLDRIVLRLLSVDDPTSHRDHRPI